MARTALFLPDGTHALIAGDDGEIVLRSLADGAVMHVFYSGQNGGANKLAISPDGRRAPVRPQDEQFRQDCYWEILSNSRRCRCISRKTR